MSKGNVGVDMFFVLSGIGLYFSYTKIDPEEGIGPRIKKFYWRRFIRLAVPYVILALPFYSWRAWGNPSEILGDFFQINFPLKKMVTTWYVTMSAIFYLLFPLIYHFQQKQFNFRGKPVGRNTVTLLLCVAEGLLCRFVWKNFPGTYANCEIGLTRILAFTIGCSLGKEVKEEKPISATAIAGSALFIPIYIYMFRPEVRMPTFWVRMSFIPFGLAALILFAYVFLKLDGLGKVRKFFAFFGERSLELYLTHVMMKTIWLRTMDRSYFDRREVVGYACIIMLSIVASTLLHPVFQKIGKKLLASTFPKTAR